MNNANFGMFLIIMLAVLAAHIVYDSYGRMKDKKEAEKLAMDQYNQMLAMMQQQQNGQDPAPQTTV